MAEVLTESFCERCGTRYTFEATGRRRRLGRIRTLSRGVKNFVANDDSSFSEAMAAAREDDVRGESSKQLDAFHRTFNFCMSCRQYTCGNCWNATAGECLSCSPDLSLEPLPTIFPDVALGGPGAQPAGVAEPALPSVAASAWPTSDLHAAHEEAVVAGPPATQPMDAAEIELTHDELAAIEGALSGHAGRHDAGPPIAEAKAAELADRDVAAISPSVGESPIEAPSAGTPEAATGARGETRRFMQRFRPRRERPARLAPPTAPVGVPTDAAADEPAPVVAPEAVVVPEAAVAPPTDVVVPEAAVAEAAVAPPTDVVVQPTWRMVAEDGAPSGEPEPGPPAWASPERATRRATDAMPSASWAARVATARPLESPVWAESSRDILAAEPRGAAGPVGIQSCVNCGLSLSANARFCRRCGSRQG